MSYELTDERALDIYERMMGARCNYAADTRLFGERLIQIADAMDANPPED